jgi:hypothetical protein
VVLDLAQHGVEIIPEGRRDIPFVCVRKGAGAAMRPLVHREIELQATDDALPGCEQKLVAAHFVHQRVELDLGICRGEMIRCCQRPLERAVPAGDLLPEDLVAIGPDVTENEALQRRAQGVDLADIRQRESGDAAGV